MKKFYLFIFIVASAACIITAQSRCEDVNVKALAKDKTADVEAQHEGMAASPKSKTEGKTKGKTASVEAQPKGKTLSADPSIHVSLMYARADNFTGRVLYGDLREAYLHPKAATALVKAQRRLKQLRPDLSLKVYDAARPMHIQQKMWDAVKNTSKDIYVSNPAHGGGMHNYGLAVDITLCDRPHRRRAAARCKPQDQPTGSAQPPVAARGHALRRLQSLAHRVVALQPRVESHGKEILQSHKIV